MITTAHATRRSLVVGQPELVVGIRTVVLEGDDDVFMLELVLQSGDVAFTNIAAKQVIRVVEAANEVQTDPKGMLGAKRRYLHW